MIGGRAIYASYARMLRTQLARGPVPRHVAIIIDGNRRWARQMGFENVSVGHRYGAELCFCDVYWPGFRHVDFLRALRAYAARRRRR